MDKVMDFAMYPTEKRVSEGSFGPKGSRRRLP
jgi:hypothetical protein